MGLSNINMKLLPIKAHYFLFDCGEYKKKTNNSQVLLLVLQKKLFLQGKR